MDFSFLSKYYPLFLQGAWITIQVSFVALFFGCILGLIVCLMKMSKISIFRWISTVYIEILRGTPLFVQVTLIYFGLPQFGIGFPAIGPFSGKMVTGMFALAITSGAYVAEILRSGIQSVDKGQMEAARSLGMGYGATMQHVLVPQSIQNEIGRSHV